MPVIAARVDDLFACMTLRLPGICAPVYSPYRLGIWEAQAIYRAIWRYARARV
jgi:hypothetical protein